MTAQDDGTSDFRSKRGAALRSGSTLLLGAVVLWLIVATAGSLYGGTGGSDTAGARQRDVTAAVESCHRQGPVSLNGLGYWWTCQARVGAATVELRHSVATRADVGHGVPVHELCTGTNHAECRYGRIVAGGWGVLIRVLDLIRIFLVPLMLFGAALEFFGLIFGERPYERLRARLRRPIRRAESSGSGNS
jgi:hypothetical protein